MAANRESIRTPSLAYELPTSALIELALQREEGTLSNTGALVVQTGSRTGRSPRDRFIVNDTNTASQVDWGQVNQPIDLENFEVLWDAVQEYLQGRPTFISHLHVGANQEQYIPLQVQAQYAWHAAFAQSIFIEPEIYNPADKTPWQLISAPDFVCQPLEHRTASEVAAYIDFTGRRVVLAGLKYAGEMKKAMFTVLNYLLPAQDVLPMHCSANADAAGNTALFFGLSGTGKTTLSADPSCSLIGDDEHGWSKSAVFNFEGGCYAKCVNLSEENEPMIYNALRFSSILENVIIDPYTRVPDYTDTRLTENTRACYPRNLIEGCIPSNSGAPASVVILLTCDVSGVLPPVSVLTPQAAAYHFLLGYTAKVGSTEVGSTEAYAATFSACFGEAFFPRQPQVYADLLIQRIQETQAKVYLVNTGWTGGGYGVGRRFDIPVTRTIVAAARTGAIDTSDLEHLPELNLHIPRQLTGVDSNLLNPRQSWSDRAAYDEARESLVHKFKQNFQRFNVEPAILAAGPQ